MERTGAGLSDTMLLIKAGCFRKIEQYNQPQLLFIAKKYLAKKYLTKDYQTKSYPVKNHPGKSSRHRMDESSASLLDPLLDSDDSLKLVPTPPPMRDLSLEQKLRVEEEVFGFITSIHPMEYYRKKINDPEVILANELSQHIGRVVKVAGILVTSKTVLTKTDELMQFISFEDETAIFETIFFPKTFKKYALLLSHQRPYILKGMVESEFGVVSLNVYEIEQM
jgi:DNA polymerase III alpha subunit